jgi:transketolase
MKNGRKAFIQTISALARKDPRIIFLFADVGFSHVEGFKEEFPNQWINCGIAEQNMLGVAAGLALAGWKPYVYTMTNFILLRPLEQLRNDICYANANVKLFGVKGGESYKFLGMSHNMTLDETTGILAYLPNLKLNFPQSEEDAVAAIEAEYERVGPAYFQI